VSVAEIAARADVQSVYIIYTTVAQHFNQHRASLSLIAEPLVRWTCVSHECQEIWRELKEL